MTVETLICEDSYIADGTATPRSIGFPLLDPSYLLVWLDGEPLTLGADFTITGDIAAGTASFVPSSPWASGAVIRYARATALVQRAAIPPGQPLPSRSIEQQLDRQTHVQQEMAGGLARSIQLPRGEIGLVLPDRDTRASGALGFDGDGGLIIYPAVQEPGPGTDVINFVADEGQSEFYIGETPNGTHVVSVNGVELYDDDWDFNNDDTIIILNQPCTEGDEVSLSVFGVVALQLQSRAERTAFRPGGSGAQVETVEQALRRFVWVDQYKLVVDADDTQSIIRAIGSGASKLLFRNRDYLVNGDIIVPGLKFLRGDGMGCTRIIQTNMTANLLRFAMAFAQAGGISDITLTSNVASFGDRGSTGMALIADNPNDNFVCERFDIISYDKQITITGGYQAHFRDFRCLFFTDYGVKLDTYSAGHEIAGTQWQSAKISNFGFVGNPLPSMGLWMLQGSGEFFRDIDITMVGLGVVGAPPVNSWVRFTRFDNVLADSCYYEGWTWDGSAGGYVLDTEMKGCWASGSGGGAFRPAGSERGAGMVVKGIALDDLRVIGGTFRDNDCGGIDLQGGSNVRVSAASISRNSRRLGYNNVYPGVRVRANVSNWSFQNCRIGNFSQGVFDVQQAENFVIETGASANFTILGCDLSNPGPGKQPFLNGSTSTNFVLLGNSPRRAAPLNISERQTLSNLCSATITAGTSAYVGPNGNAADAFSSAHIVDRPGVMTGVKITVPAPPGAGQSYTYTVYLNGNPTGMTGQITDSAQAAVIEAAFLVAENDAVTTLVAASAGAAAVRHNVINQWSP